MLALRRSTFAKLLDALSQPTFNDKLLPAAGFAQRFKFRDRDDRKAGDGYFRRTVHYPEKYTLKPLPYTNLGGRDPNTGRVVVGTLGGGIKHPFLWVDYIRHHEPGTPPLVERVLEIIHELSRSAHMALVGSGDKCRYIIATENMKPGDLIVTSSELTRIAVRPNEGDAYPIGSLPVSTEICCVEGNPGTGGFFARSAGTYCTIVRKLGQKVIMLTPSKREFAIEQTCMAVVGRVSNAIHSSIPIGSANNLRALGYRPRSGWWQRKTGRHGRKIRKPPPMQEWLLPEDMPQKSQLVKMTMPEFPYHFA